MPCEGPSTEQLRSLAASLRAGTPADDSVEAIERLRLLEELKSAACAAQAEQAVRLDAVQRTEQAVAGEPASRQG